MRSTRDSMPRRATPTYLYTSPPRFSVPFSVDEDALFRERMCVLEREMMGMRGIHVVNKEKKVEGKRKGVSKKKNEQDRKEGGRKKRKEVGDDKKGPGGQGINRSKLSKYPGVGVRGSHPIVSGIYIGGATGYLKSSINGLKRPPTVLQRGQPGPREGEGAEPTRASTQSRQMPQMHSVQA